MKTERIDETFQDQKKLNFSSHDKIVVRVAVAHVEILGKKARDLIVSNKNIPLKNSWLQEK